jgi:hemolysin III
MYILGEPPTAAATAVPDFPLYTKAEASVDLAIHVGALAAASYAVSWLFVVAIRTADIQQAIGLVIYGCALAGMLTSSAAYNFSRPGGRKELLRRVDRAMIFVTIAGTYTPFTLYVFRGQEGLLACLPIWSLAAVGITVTFAFPRRFERLLLALYLVMGWIVLGMGPSFIHHLATPVQYLLLAGGVAYSVGAFIHARCRFRFDNVVWHALVVLGACWHWMAVIRQFTQTDAG